MKLHLVTAVSLLALGSAPVLAQDAAPTPAPEKKICRGIVPTGSIMSKRICLTKTEWREFDRLNQEDADTALGKKPGVSPRERPG